MATKKKSATMKFLDDLLGEPLPLGAFLKSERTDAGLSLADMAKKLKVTRQHLQAVEAGRSSVSIDRAIRWARLLGYVDELFVELALQAAVNAARPKIRLRVRVQPLGKAA